MGASHNHSHKHAHGHSHGHDHGLSGPGSGDYLNRAFIIGIVINLVFVAVEFVAGVMVDSVALMSDAGHNLSDVISLALALMAFRLAKLRPTNSYTYGRKKSTVIVSLANACILLVAVGLIVYESVMKLIEPQPVEGGVIAWVAGVGILINGFTAWLFMKHRKNDLNVKGAYLHMAADALVSAGVVVSGIIISFTGWYALDPIIGIVVAVIIFISTWGLLRDSVRLSLDGVPPGIDVEAIVKDIRDVDAAVQDVHHVHIWPLSTTENALTAHVVLAAGSDAAGVKCRVKEMLVKHGIGHATLEIELPGEHCSAGSGECA